MTTISDRCRMGTRVWICVIVLVAAAVLSCSKKDGGGRSARGPGPAEIALTDDELTSSLAWSHDYMALVNKHKAELDAVTERGAAKLSFNDTGKIAQDPELLATVERQRTATQAQIDSMPLKGAKATALGETLAGIGSMVFQTNGLVYVPRRDEEALARARKKYGDEYVQWVLSRESTIHRTMSQ